MSLDREHLREISRNAVAILGAVAVAIGPVVAANTIRTVYFIKLASQGNPVARQVVLYRNGAVGTIILDTVQVPGVGTGVPGVTSQLGRCWFASGMDIEVPVYVLLEGEQMGGLIPAGVGFAFISYFDETG